ncbi:MAG: hydrogenase iron-sulfur subunit [Candidatus Thorarchaeota archaeon]
MADAASKPVVVIGAGIAGMRASLDLAEMGAKVYLVERRPSIGGHMSQLDKTFPTLDCSMCIQGPWMVDCSRNPNIEILAYSEVQEVTGKQGDFSVKVLKRTRRVDADKCTGCGECERVCPIEIPNEYDEGLKMRKAAYIPFPQAVPNIATIDYDNCIECMVCVKTCKAEAIIFDIKDEIIEINAGSIIVATGFEMLDLSTIPEYGYGRFPNVVSALEFERMVSASGPTGGVIMRPSDGREPHRIAFVQCVGSRDVNHCSYCSKICCTYATKEAIITKEHTPEVHIDILYNDLRVFGKGFEEFYVRGETEYGINYLKGLPSEIMEDPSNQDLLLRHSDAKGHAILEDRYELVVLCPAMVPSKEDELYEQLGIKTDENGFIHASGTFVRTAETGIPGVHMCGACDEPKDIPDSVAQGSAAAALAALDITILEGDESDALTESDLELMAAEPRIGVIICSCGTNIAGTVDVAEVTDYSSKLPNVVYAENLLYSCSSDAQVVIKDAIKEHKLNRLVVSACTPRTHEPLFRKTIEEAGLNKYLFEFANIREHCSWVHQADKDEATSKAMDLVRMSVARAKLLEAQEEAVTKVIPLALVIGAGVAGMSAADVIAQKGYNVILVEKEDKVGGFLNELATVNFDHHPTSKLVAEYEKRVTTNPNIKLMLSSEVIEAKGAIGDFDVVIKSGKTKEEMKVGVVIVATGAVALEEKGLYGLKKLPEVMTEVEFNQRLISGEGIQDGETFGVIHCAGSREDESLEGARTWCSGICCTIALEHSLELLEKYPNSRIIHFYRDMRVFYTVEDKYREARKKGIIFVRFDKDSPPKVKKGKDKALRVDVTDQVLGAELMLDVDHVVLATAMVPRDNKAVSELFKVPLNLSGFFMEAHPKLRPVDFQTDGIFVAGTATAPKSTAEAISEGQAAASRALIPLIRGIRKAEAIVSVVDPEICVGCGTCEINCAYNAIEVIPGDGGHDYAVSNPVLCAGCGKCGAGCPAGAITMKHFTDDQIISQIRAALEDMPASQSRILTIICNWCTYAGADSAGVARLQQPTTVRDIRVMCTGRVGVPHILEAFRLGADMVWISGCHFGDCHYVDGNVSFERRFAIAKKIVEKAGLEPERLQFTQISASEGPIWANTVKEFSELADKLGPSPLRPRRR